MQKTIGYIRVSTNKQDFERQREEIIEYAKKNDFTIVRFFEDKQSGSDYEERKGFQDLLAYLEEHTDIKIILFDEISRMGRDTAMQVATYKALTKKGVRVFTRGKGEFGKNKEDSLLFTILSAIADYEKQTIIDRTSSGRRKVVRDGNTQTSQAPYGYDLVFTQKRDGNITKRQTFSINKKEAEVVKEIFKIVDNNESTFEVLRFLRSNSIPAPKGGKWGKSSVLRILHNPTYYGEWLFGKYIKNGKTKYSMSKRPKEDLISVKVPSIIDKELFERVQKKLDKRRNFNPKNLKKTFLLQGLFKCQCGHSLQCISENKAGYKIYRCPERNIEGISEKTCPIKAIKADFIEKILLQEIKKKIEDDSFMSEVKLKKLDKLIAPIKTLEKRKEVLSKEYASDNEKLKKYYEKYVSLLESNPEKAKVFESLADDLLKDINKNKEEIEQINYKLAEEKKKTINYELFKDIKKALAYIKEKDLEEFKSNDKKIDFVRTYIKEARVGVSPNATKQIRSKILHQRKGIFSKKNKPLKDLYSAVADKNHQIKKGALQILELDVEFVNNYIMNITFPYFHQNPHFIISYLKENKPNLLY